MSCQQVPRLSEDPYTFTETTSTTPALFNPQIHKLTPIITTAGAAQKQIVTPKSQVITQTRLGPTTLQTPQILTARINGASQIINGLHKNVTATSTTINKIQPQIQYTTAKITTSIPAKRFLTPGSPSSSSLANQTLPQYSIAKQAAIISTASVQSTASVPPLYQRNVIVTSCGSIVPQAESISPQQKNHSSNLKPTLTGIRLPVATAAPPVFLQNINAATAVTIGAQRKIQQPAVVKVNPVHVDVRPTNPEGDKRKLTTDKNVFVTPAKRDTRVFSSSGKKGRATSAPNIRTKRSYSQTSHHEVLQRIPSSPSSTASATEWHAPDSYIFDSISSISSLSNLENCDKSEIVPCVQSNWLDAFDIVRFIPPSTPLTREQRIELRKAQLRRQAMQYFLAQPFRNQHNARGRLVCVSKILRKLKNKDEITPPKKCCFPNCVNSALALTAYCYLHITRNPDQYLFLPCTAKFADNSQCRIPVFDISHELPLCREHAWKRDNYIRIVQEQKPKKPPRKRPKPSAMTRPQKRNKKKKRILGVHGSEVTTGENVFANKIEYQIKSNNSYSNTNISGSIDANQMANSQDILSICDNSSAYESSEDTGVGGLSESELIAGAQDVIEEIPLADARLLEEHDLTNVLNQLPVDAFNELFTTVQQSGPLEPTLEEQEDLERALEAVNKQVKSLQQMTGSDTNFLGDFLDVDDQILDDPDICSDVLHSSDTSGIDASNILVDGGSNSTGSCSTSQTEMRELVQT